MKAEKSLQQLHQELQVKAVEQGIPIFGGFELTPRCNLSCKMCYVKYKGAGCERKDEELTAKQWIALGRAAAEQGALTVFITGGEPFLRQDFQEIYEAFCKLGFRITLFSNGTLITDEIAKWLSAFPPATVDITLYGASEDTYENLCGVRGAFGKALNGIEQLRKYGINTRIKSTIVKPNLGDYHKIKEIADSYRLEFLSNNLIHGNRAQGIDDCAAIRLSPEEMFTFNLNSLEEYDLKPTNMEERRDWIRQLPAMNCTAGRCSFFVNWQGQMTPCPLFVDPHTEPFVHGFQAAWNQLREAIDAIPAPEKCKSCETRAYCPVCPPRLYLETGSFDQHAEYLCQLANVKERVVKKSIPAHSNSL